VRKKIFKRRIKIFEFRSFSTRAYIIFGCFILLIAISSAKAFSLQITNYAVWKEKALAQQVGGIDLIPKRGEIFFQDKNGNLVPAAINKKKYNIAIDPSQIKEEEREEIVEVLSEKLEISKESILAKISKPNDPYELLKQNVESGLSQELKQEIPSLILEEKDFRSYPNYLANQTIGFCSFDNATNRCVGKYGLEAYYDSLLRGDDPKETTLARILQNGVWGAINNFYVADGADLILTIDPVIQQEVEKDLKLEVQKWSAKSGNVIVMDPKTGKILALANYPDFNNNEYNKVKDISIFLNSAVSSRYEPGSVFKPFTLAAGLESGKITKNSSYFDKGEITLNNKTIRNAGGSAPNKMISMELFLQRSYNLGAVFIEQTIGNEYFKDFILNNLEFDEKTNIDLPAEINNSFNNLLRKEAQDIDFATASFGQGIAVTPIKLIQEFAAFANGGDLVKPYIVDYIRIDDQQTYTKSMVIKKVLKTETLQQEIPLLESVVSGERGSGFLAKIEGYRIAGKTGTGEIPLENGKGYSNKVNHTFVGFGPVSDPKVIILTRIEDPKGVNYAEATAVPLFRKIMKFIIDYYAISPDALIN